MPFFSTVIPSYNRRDLIAATLDSVLAQQFSDNEIIVVDDGSTDGTLDVLAGYGSRIRVIEQPNSGPGPARNLGVKHATGQYVAFLDSDDLWLPWTLSTYRDIIARFPAASIIAARHQDFFEHFNSAGIAQQPLACSYYDSFLDSPRGWTLPSAMVLKAGTLEAAGGYTGDIRIVEDGDFWLRVGCAPGFVQIQAPTTVGYRVHPAGISQNWAGRAKGVFYLIDHEKKAAYPGGPRYRRARLDYICRHARPTSLQCARQGLLGLAGRLYTATAMWNLQLCRARYLAAFPAVLALSGLRSIAARISALLRSRNRLSG